MNHIRQKSKRDLMTHKQYEMNKRSRRDTVTTEVWMKENGFNAVTFGKTHIELLQAQKLAQILITNHASLLTQSQIQIIENFQQKMTSSKLRSKLKPSAAYPILNINTKINRQLFKQNRHQSNH